MYMCCLGGFCAGFAGILEVLLPVLPLLPYSVCPLPPHGRHCLLRGDDGSAAAKAPSRPLSPHFFLAGFLAPPLPPAAGIDAAISSRGMPVVNP